MVAKGGMAPRPMVPTMTICGPRLSWTKYVNMVCTVTPAVIPPSSAYIGFLQELQITPFNSQVLKHREFGIKLFNLYEGYMDPSLLFQLHHLRE